MITVDHKKPDVDGWLTTICPHNMKGSSGIQVKVGSVMCQKCIWYQGRNEEKHYVRCGLDK